MKEKKISPAYRVLRFFVWLFTPKMKLEGLENLPDEPAIIVANHVHMEGPIACQLHFPGKRCIWCAGEMMDKQQVADYAYRDFWSHKPKRSQPFYRFLSHLITPLALCIFNNADTIPVYHDARLLTTFRRSMEQLDEGANIIIFPEHEVEHNNIIYDFQDRFIDIARMYYRRSGRELCFVPMYIAPCLKKIYLGRPIRFDHNKEFKAQRELICSHLMEQITDTARSLPEHKVVPYPNVARKYYGTNLERGESEK